MVKEYLVAIDLGSKCGIAWGDVNEPLCQYHIMVDVRQLKKKFTSGSFKAYWFVLKTIIEADLGEANVRIVYERPSSMPRWNTLKIHHGLAGITELISECCKNVLSTETVPPLTIKKFWTGSGRASKEEMVDATQILHPKVTDDNESDAIALWYYYQADVLKITPEIK